MLHLSTHPILEVKLSLVPLHGIFLGFCILNLGGAISHTDKTGLVILSYPCAVTSAEQEVKKD